LGPLLFALGFWRVIDPISFFENNSGVILSNDPGLLNEARGAGGAIVEFGFIIFLGALKSKMAFTSIVVAITLFNGFAVARFTGFALDGNIVDGQFQGAIMEIAFGSVTLFCLLSFRVKAQG
jgi:hypothetical protein